MKFRRRALILMMRFGATAITAVGDFIAERGRLSCGSMRRLRPKRMWRRPQSLRRAHVDFGFQKEAAAFECKRGGFVVLSLIEIKQS
jgi:hypothetical protein